MWYDQAQVGTVNLTFSEGTTLSTTPTKPQNVPHCVATGKDAVAKSSND